MKAEIHNKLVLVIDFQGGEVIATPRTYQEHIEAFEVIRTWLDYCRQDLELTAKEG